MRKLSIFVKELYDYILYIAMCWWYVIHLIPKSRILPKSEFVRRSVLDGWSVVTVRRSTNPLSLPNFALLHSFCEHQHQPYHHCLLVLNKDSFDISNYLTFLLSDWLLNRSSEAPPAVVQCILWSRRFHLHKGKIFLKAVQFVQFDQFPPCARAKLRVNAHCSTTTNVQNNSSSKFWSEFISQREETARNYKRKTKQNTGWTAKRCWKNKSLLCQAHCTLLSLMLCKGWQVVSSPLGIVGSWE